MLHLTCYIFHHRPNPPQQLVKSNRALQEVPPPWTICSALESQRREKMRMDIWWQGILPTLKCHNCMCCCAVGETFLTIGRLKSDSKGTRFWNSEDLTLNKKWPPQCKMIWWSIMICTEHDSVMFGLKVFCSSYLYVMYAKFDIGISWYHDPFISNFAGSYDDSWYMMVNNNISAKNNMYKSAIIEKKPLLVKRQYVKP